MSGTNRTSGAISHMDVVILVVDGVADFSLAALLDVLGVANVLREELDPRPWRGMSGPCHLATVSAPARGI